MVSRGVVPVGKTSGGAELVAFQLAVHLAGRGEEAVLVSDVDAPMLQHVPAKLSVAEVGTYRGLGRLVRLVPADFPRWVLQHLLGNVRAAHRARTMLQADDQDFDAVHVHGALAAVLLHRVMRGHARRIPLVYTEHDLAPWSCRYRHWFEHLVRRCVYRWVNLRACRVATVVAVNFPSLADSLAARAAIPRSRFITVRNAVEAGWLVERRGGDSMKARHGFDRYCLFVGSLTDRKGPDVLLRALAEVSMACVFVGDGPMRTALERLAARSGIASRVVFTGALERHDLRRYFSRAAALILPSVSEGVPLVAIEALGAGVPVIASDLMGIASVVRDGENGLLIGPGDKASLVRALSAFETDKALRIKLKNGAKRSGRAFGAWPDVVNQLCALYALHQPLGTATASPPDGLGAPGPADALAAQGLAPALPIAAPRSPAGRAAHA